MLASVLGVLIARLLFIPTEVFAISQGESEGVPAGSVITAIPDFRVAGERVFYSGVYNGTPWFGSLPGITGMEPSIFDNKFAPVMEKLSMDHPRIVAKGAARPGIVAMKAKGHDHTFIKALDHKAGITPVVVIESHHPPLMFHMAAGDDRVVQGLFDAGKFAEAHAVMMKLFDNALNYAEGPRTKVFVAPVRVDGPLPLGHPMRYMSFPERRVLISGDPSLASLQHMESFRTRKNPDAPYYYYMDPLLVTEDDWDEIMGSGIASARRKADKYHGANYPKGSISWYDVLDYIHKRFGGEAAHILENVERNLEGRIIRAVVAFVNPYGIRPATTVEWGHAVRRGTKFLDLINAGQLGKVAWYKENSGGHSHEVATRNPIGSVYDLPGLFWEWVQTTSGGVGMYGGSWSTTAKFLQSEHSVSLQPDSSGTALGVRLVQAVP